jgi:hypothetical protein
MTDNFVVVRLAGIQLCANSRGEREKRNVGVLVVGRENTFHGGGDT